ncbi:DUF982 domain-containing protein [Pararhizobium sp. BT-229]|uniref:DUF982 domain-containing protein n=1 Tax=Pararhizobium sp. BT-229 TaxID=2986923 RepID=UPI0021F7E0F3|nr:DUF982 domain-containing protein [Pararhizobium sp. BT-229]MCV9967012.1 DUF982 domain-containing protein [Pararhizobium sp. BT-229]
MEGEDVRWSHALKVTRQNGLVRKFDSVYEAQGFLEKEWPRKRGEHHDRALVMCRGTLGRMTLPTLAREAFAAACWEAGMVVETVRPRQAQPKNHPSLTAWNRDRAPSCRLSQGGEYDTGCLDVYHKTQCGRRADTHRRGRGCFGRDRQRAGQPNHA